MTTHQHIMAIGVAFLTVSDQDRAIAFYRDTLGFKLRSDEPFGEGMRWVEVAPPGAHTVVALNLPMMGSTPGGNAAFCFETPDLTAAIDHLTGRGVEFDDPMPTEGSMPSMAYFSDPDGNRILLVETSHAPV